MALTTLPIDASEPAYTIDTDLSGVVFRIRIEWNTRGEFWTIGLLEMDDTVIVDGQAIRADWEPFRQIVDERMPAGRIIVVDMTGAGTDPAYDDLGVRVLVMYDDGL